MQKKHKSYVSDHFNRSNKPVKKNDYSTWPYSKLGELVVQIQEKFFEVLLHLLLVFQVRHHQVNPTIEIFQWKA